jgi:hypothetical protein
MKVEHDTISILGEGGEHYIKCKFENWQLESGKIFKTIQEAQTAAYKLRVKCLEIEGYVDGVKTYNIKVRNVGNINP